MLQRRRTVCRRRRCSRGSRLSTPATGSTRSPRRRPSWGLAWYINHTACVPHPAPSGSSPHGTLQPTYGRNLQPRALTAHMHRHSWHALHACKTVLPPLLRRRRPHLQRRQRSRPPASVGSPHTLQPHTMPPARRPRPAARARPCVAYRPSPRRRRCTRRSFAPRRR